MKAPQHCSYRLNNEARGDDDRLSRQNLTNKYIQFNYVLPVDVS